MFQDLVIGPDIIEFVHHHGYKPDDVKKNIIAELDEMLINEIIWIDIKLYKIIMKYTK